MVEPLHWTAGLHHDGSALYVSNPLPRLGETVRVSLRVPVHAPIRAAFLRINPDGEPRNLPLREVGRDDLCVWLTADFTVTMYKNPYRFKLLTDEGAYHLNQLGVSRVEQPDWYDFKLIADFAAPGWLADSVFYQIFPDRFYNGDPSNDVQPGEWSVDRFTTQQRPWGAPPLPYREGGTLDFYGGDLQGIAQKIDYLCDLGVNALYLTPIFRAKTNHRYDVMDFENIDPHVGGNEGLIALRQALDAVDMRLIMDITLNHCGWFHDWFRAAQADPNAPTGEFFTFYRHPDEYEMWLGVKSLPKLNYRSEKLRDRLYRDPDSALRRWLRQPYRIDGWRLDVANMQARQGKFQLHHKVGRQIRRAVKGEKPDAYLYGENFYDGTPHLQGDELDAIMNYQGFAFPLIRWLSGNENGFDWGKASADKVLMPAEAAAGQWAEYRAAVPWAIARQQFNLLGSHDTTRILNALNGDRALLKVAVTALMTYPGVPCVYYGDEIGMPGGNDPDNRRCMPWDEEAWDKELRAHYQRMIRLRRGAPALTQGGFQQLYARGGLMAYQRQSAEQRLVVIGYRGPEAAENAAIPVWHGGLRDGARLVDVFNGGEYRVERGALALGRVERATALVLEER